MTPSRPGRTSPSAMPPGAKAWLEARPSIVKENFPWWTLSFDGLEGLDERDLRAIAVAIGFVSDEVELADASRGDLVARLAGWPWTAIVRREEELAPPEVPEEEVVWWLDDLLDLLDFRNEQELIDHVRSATGRYISVLWSAGNAVRIDVLGPHESTRLEFVYPFSFDTFDVGLRYPFDEQRHAWKPLSELKQLAVEAGFANSLDQLDDVCVNDIVSWFDSLRSSVEDETEDTDEQQP